MNNLIIIPGAQKSGTTTLYNILKEHKEIGVFKNSKEPEFFALNQKTINKNLPWYKRQFPKDTKFGIDASTFYLSNKDAPGMIAQSFKNAKIIILLRDPIKRAYSGYLQMYKRAPCADKRNFSDIIKKITRNIVKSENQALRQAIKNKQIDVNYLDENYLYRFYNAPFKSKFTDKLWPYKYFQESVYSKKVKKYQDIFGKNVKIIFFEELILKKDKIIKDIFNFLELDPPKNNLELPHAYKTKIPRNIMAKYLLETLKGGPKRLAIIKKIRKTKLINFLRYLQAPLYKNKIPLSEKDYKKARRFMKEEYNYWFLKKPELKKFWKF
jgi:hypothetical protein